MTLPMELELRSLLYKQLIYESQKKLTQDKNLIEELDTDIKKFSLEMRELEEKIIHFSIMENEDPIFKKLIQVGQQFSYLKNLYFQTSFTKHMIKSHNIKVTKTYRSSKRLQSKQQQILLKSQNGASISNVNPQ